MFFIFRPFPFWIPFGSPKPYKMRSKSLPNPSKMASRKASKNRCLKFMMFKGFWSQNGPKMGSKIAETFHFWASGSVFSATSAQDRPRHYFSCFWKPFWMFLELILKLWPWFWLPQSQKNAKNMPIFLLPPRIASLKTSGGGGDRRRRLRYLEWEMRNMCLFDYLGGVTPTRLT